VHGIVKSLHGFIEVESKPGKGSTFHVYIPALAETVATPAEAGTNDIAKGRERILVVDDDFVIAEMNRRILELLGYTVAVTTSSKEALAQVRAHGDDFDLVLTDQCMPNLSGVELAREIVRIRPDLPIILCSGYISNVTKEEALACGIRKYVMKPVELSTLSRIVREVLDEE
jgi:CheY-like chemotaxis protein